MSHTPCIGLSPEVANDNQPFGGDDGIGGYAPLAAVTGSGASATVTWIHGNHLGVPAVYADASGTAVAAPNYTLPGFPGQLKTLGDLYYNRYRDYDSSTGRYIQADPIGLEGGDNLYLYANANPLRFVDPDGKVPLPVVIVAGGIALDLALQALSNWYSGNDVFDRDCYSLTQAAVAGGGMLVAGPLIGRASPYIGHAGKWVGGKSGRKFSAVSPSQPGSYTNLHASGAKYHGKGSRARSQYSARRKEKDVGDQHIATEWNPSQSHRDAFKDESRRLDADGGPKSTNNYNKIDSPGKRYRKDDLEQ